MKGCNFRFFAYTKTLRPDCLSYTREWQVRYVRILCEVVYRPRLCCESQRDRTVRGVPLTSFMRQLIDSQD